MRTARSIGIALKESLVLNTVLLAHNGLKSEGAIDIADALRKNGTITKLDLRGNDIDDEGAVSVGRACRYVWVWVWLCS